MNRYSLLAVAVTAVAVAWQAVDAATTTTSAPTFSATSLESRLEREVATPLRDRHLGWRAFSRARPQFDESQVRAVVADPRPGPDGWIAFRVETPAFRLDGPPRVAYVGRLDPSSGRIDLASASLVASGEPAWRPLSEVVQEQGR